MQSKLTNETQAVDTQSMQLSEDEESNTNGPNTGVLGSREGRQDTSISYLTKENMVCPSSNNKQF